MSIEDADYQALAAFRRALREFIAFSEGAARAAGLTPQQHQAILAIRAHEGPTSVGDLAEGLSIRSNSATELVSRLAKAGLVERFEAADDKRRIELRLTKKAGDLLASLSAVHFSELRRRRALLKVLFNRLNRAQ